MFSTIVPFIFSSSKGENFVYSLSKEKSFVYSHPTVTSSSLPIFISSRSLFIYVPPICNFIFLHKSSTFSVSLWTNSSSSSIFVSFIILLKLTSLSLTRLISKIAFLISSSNLDSSVFSSIIASSSTNLSSSATVSSVVGNSWFVTSDELISSVLFSLLLGFTASVPIVLVSEFSKASINGLLDTSFSSSLTSVPSTELTASDKWLTSEFTNASNKEELVSSTTFKSSSTSTFLSSKRFSVTLVNLKFKSSSLLETALM